jgi:3-phenylpropionate/trans-cinnamate dioxygenase ferredoxin reductase component
MLLGTSLSHLTADGVHLSDGRVLPADSIVAGIGAAPDVRLAAEAGLTIQNGIACNEYMQTSDADIYAAGDCASFITHKFGRRRMRLEAWRSAQEQAATAAENMTGGSKVHDAIPWFWSDQYDLGLQIAGMADMGPNTVTRKISSNSVVLFHLDDSGTLMGASGIGPGTSIGRDVKISEMMIAKNMKPSAELLADPEHPLKAILKG